jgi:hypothetical protein
MSTTQQPRHDAGALKDAVARPMSFLQTVQAVAWSFFGVRKRAGFEQDVTRLNPIHLIVAGILGALLFIGVLLVLVRWVVSSGVAG